jgi:hypothetical protein
MVDAFLAHHPVLASIASNLSWDALKYVWFSGLIWAALRWTFGLLKTARQNLAFWLTVPFIMGAATFLWTSPTVAPTPNLIGGMDAVQVFASNQCVSPMPYPNSDPDDVYILIAADVRNTGSPSIADGWSLAVNSLTKGLVAPEGLQLPDTTSLFLEDAVTKTQSPYSGRDALYEKTFQNPVPQGAEVRGILLYRVKGYRVEDLSKPGTEYKLSFTDILGGTHIIDWVWPQNNKPIGHLAGLLNPVLPETGPSPIATPTSEPKTPLDLLR